MVPILLCTRQAFTFEENDTEAESHLLMFPFAWDNPVKEGPYINDFADLSFCVYAISYLWVCC